MKQHITTYQILELSIDNRKKLREWQLAKNYHHPLTADCDLNLYTNPTPLSIGQLIEFLDENENIVNIEKKDEVIGKWFRVSCGERLIDNYDELCDALFSAVKEILEK